SESVVFGARPCAVRLACAERAPPRVRCSVMGSAPLRTPASGGASSEVAPGDFGPGALRLELDVALPAGAGAPRDAELFVGHRQVEVGVCELGVRRDGALEQGDALLGPPLLEHDVAEVVLSLRLLLVDGERLAVVGLGSLGVVSSEADVAEVR